MHPLELFDRFRRWFSWASPGGERWERTPDQMAPDQTEDWLLEPVSQEEACALFPHLNPEQAVVHYQRVRLVLREKIRDLKFVSNLEV